MDIYTILLLVALGTIPGYYAGRWRAENGRARADMRGTWRNRRNYRS